MKDRLNYKVRNFALLNTRDKIKERTKDINNIINKEIEATKHIIYKKIFFHIKKEMNLLLFFYIFFIFFSSSQQKKIIRYLNSVNQITLVMKGSGSSYLPIFSGSEAPNSIILNGENQPDANTFILLSEPLNTIILSWNSPVTTCSYMFSNIQNLISIDLSQFDTSSSTQMNSMFYNCKNLKTVKLNNIDTSSINEMNSMFENCISLQSLDLSSFNTQSVKKMKYMFKNCISLESLDLSNFNTNHLETIESMFYNASSLISLDLSGFDITPIRTFNNMLSHCESLVYLNLNLNQDNPHISSTNNILNDGLSNIIYCIDATKAPHIAEVIGGMNSNNDCSNTCFSSSSKIIVEKKQCIDDCSNDNTYIYEYKKRCYNYPHGDNSDINNNDPSTENTENYQKTEYIMNTEITDNELSQSSEITDKETDEMTDKNNKDEEIDIVTDNTKENDESTNIIEEKTEKNTVLENNENTEVVQKFSSENFFKETQQQINAESPIKKDEIINNIKEDLKNGNLNTLLENVIQGEKKDLITQDKDIIFQITTSENQQNTIYTNISTINLGGCEQTLKDIYHINDSLPLIILKVDYYMPGLLIPIIGYEVYNPENKSQLNLTYCKDLVKLNIPVSINEDKTYKYDPKSDFYNDECSTYTTENGTDILINDRQKEYKDNNYSLCENKCEYNGYDQKTKKASCECETKPAIGSISDIIKDENVLSSDFNTTDDKSSNIAAMKCVDALFSKEGLLTNIGSYLLIFSIVFFSFSTVIFYKCGYHFIESNINELMKLKSKKKKSKTDIYSKQSKKTLKKLKKKKKKHSNPVKKRFRKDLKSYEEKELSQKTSSKLKIRSIDIRLNMQNNKNNQNNTLRKKKTQRNKSIQLLTQKIEDDSCKFIKYKNCELNSMNYEKALQYDNRSFSHYYLSLLISKHVILFSFYPTNDYNIKIIKVSIFFLSFDIYFAVNTFFFNDTAIHQIYEDNGKYNYSFFMPKILLAFIISYIAIDVIRYFSLSERFLIEIRNEENKNKVSNLVSSSKRCLVIKYIVFYILSFIFLIIFWYYLSSFCAIFQNTQIYLAINSFLSFGISIIFPLLYNLIPGFVRIYSLNSKSECFYNFNKILQLF